MSSDFARELGRQTDETATLDVGVSMLVDLIAGCDHAGITTINRTGATTIASTSDTVRAGDDLQYQLNEGPCLDSIRIESSVVSNQLATDRRWPTWAPAVSTQLNVNSMMSVLLYADETTHSIGALNLYSNSADSYTQDDLLLAEGLAAQFAVAITAERQRHHQHLALVNRTTIGQAQGMIMLKYDVDAATSFAYLRRVSQDTNRRISAIALDIVTTRRMPNGDALAP